MKKLLFILVLVLVISAKKSSKFKDWKQRKLECEKIEACTMDSTENCVNRCISANCYEKAYSKKPLEPGEVDKARSTEFSECLRAEDRNRRNARDDL